jgi:hypothetical protein
MGNRKNISLTSLLSCQGRVYSQKKSAESSVVDSDPESGYGSGVRIWIRNRSDPKLLAGSGSGSGKNHSGSGSGQLRIRNYSEKLTKFDNFSQKGSILKYKFLF